jgi:hypothetical protein
MGAQALTVDSANPPMVASNPPTQFSIGCVRISKQTTLKKTLDTGQQPKIDQVVGGGRLNACG